MVRGSFFRDERTSLVPYGRCLGDLDPVLPDDLATWERSREDPLQLPQDLDSPPSESAKTVARLRIECRQTLGFPVTTIFISGAFGNSDRPRVGIEKTPEKTEFYKILYRWL